jgi:DNA repair exonuclease SbcCD ATPase subunit
MFHMRTPVLACPERVGCLKDVEIKRMGEEAKSQKEMLNKVSDENAELVGKVQAMDSANQILTMDDFQVEKLLSEAAHKDETMKQNDFDANKDQRELLELRDKLETLQQMGEDANNDVMELQVDVKQKERLIAELEGKVKNEKKEVSTLTSKLGTLQLELERMEEKFKNENKEVLTLMSQLGILRLGLERTKAEIAAADEVISLVRQVHAWEMWNACLTILVFFAGRRDRRKREQV